MTELIRWQFDLPSELNDRLLQLQADGGFETKKDMVNTAFTLLEWVVKQAKQGRSIASVDDAAQTMRELEMKFMEKLRNDNVPGDSSITGPA